MRRPSEDLAALAPAWRAAARRAEVRGALESVFGMIREEVARRGPACWASGRCCDFDRAGHLLYATGLETAYTLSRLDETPQRTGATALPILEPRANGEGACRFQSGNLCMVHEIKPVGCRVYFCDRGAQEWQRALHERALGEVRALHERFDVAYRYGEWRVMLEAVSSS